MRNIPVDPNLNVVIAGPSGAATTETGEHRRDSEGRPLFNQPVIALAADGSAEPFVVRVAGPLPTLPPLTRVRLIGLTARAWAMPATGRSGVSFAASALEPVK